MIMLAPKKRALTIHAVWQAFLALPEAVRRAKIKLALQKRRPQPKLP